MDMFVEARTRVNEEELDRHVEQQSLKAFLNRSANKREPSLDEDSQAPSPANLNGCQVTYCWQPYTNQISYPIVI